MPRPTSRRWFGNRPLPRPEEDLEDQGLAFDVGTLLERRKVLSAMGLGAVAFTLAACSSGGTGSSSGQGEIPDETAGPYPGDGSNGPDVLERSGIVRSDIRSSFDGGSATAEGIAMTLELTILDLANDNKPFAGVAVYVWHCNREGGYSMYSSGLEDENYLRGVQVADANGIVRFTSIFPACYSGRWPHIHFEVYPEQGSITDSSNAIATSQVALPQDVCDTVYATTGYEASVRNLQGVSLGSDNVFGDDEAASQLAAVTGNTTAGYRVSLQVPVDTGTKPSGGSVPGGQGAPGGQAPGGQPPARPGQPAPTPAPSSASPS